MATAPGLCSACSSIFAVKEQPPDEELFLHHVDESSFWKAVDGGCMMCSVLSKELTSSVGARARFQPDIRFEFKHSFTGDLGDANLGHFEVTLYLLEYDNPADTDAQEQENSKRRRVSKARFWLSPSSGRATIRSVDLQGHDTNSRQAMSRAKAWLESCKQDHRACSTESRSADYVPTRLVDLDPLLGDEQHIRVIETESQPVHEPYMTLSHRWGTYKFPMFTEANRPRMLEGFSIKSLPQTFQDAARVTRQFGIRYLWIDCLCILQGSAQDFEKEAGLMHQVYGSSYCNICATGARDNYEPLFSKRGLSNPSQLEIQLAWQQSASRKYTLFDAQLWKHAVFTRPVNQRAWVMQERFLAPCVLHFGAGQLFWECRQLHACEQYPHGLPTAITFGAYDLKTIDLPREADLDMSPQLRVYKLWCMLLYTYTRCGLTQASDKLIALAGIANRVSETLQDRFLAGVWHSWLMYDLCWSLDFASYVSAPKPLAFYRAPSWSWASLEGPLNLGGSVPIHPSARLACEILEASAVPVSQRNPFGAVRSAELVILAQLSQFVVRPDDLLESSPTAWHQMARAGAARFQINGVPMLRMGIAVSFDDASTRPPSSGLWCFAVRREDHETDDDWDLYEEEESNDKGPSHHEEDCEDPEPCNSRGNPVPTDPFIFGLVVAVAHLDNDFPGAIRPMRNPSLEVIHSNQLLSDKADVNAKICFRRVGLFTLGGTDVVDAYETACDKQPTTFRLI